MGSFSRRKMITAAAVAVPATLLGSEAEAGGRRGRNRCEPVPCCPPPRAILKLGPQPEQNVYMDHETVLVFDRVRIHPDLDPTMLPAAVVKLISITFPFTELAKVEDSSPKFVPFSSAPAHERF